MEETAALFNGLDWALIVLAAAAFGYGVYRGFFDTVKHLLGVVISAVLSVAAYPVIAKVLSSLSWLTAPLKNFIAGNELISTLAQNAAEPLNDLLAKIDGVMDGMALPQFFADALAKLVSAQDFTSTIEAGDYAVQTAVMLCINILAFVLTFTVLSVVVALLMRVIGKLFEAPVLKQADRILGGTMALLIVYIVCTVAFMLVPVAESAMAESGFLQLIGESKVAKIYIGNPLSNFIANILSGFFV